MRPPASTLLEAAREVLLSAAPEAKSAAAETALQDALSSRLPVGNFNAGGLPIRPARPDAPELVPPADVPRRRLGSSDGRAALLHAIAHIEFNAIDLAFDMAARFAGEIDLMGLDPLEFIKDWFSVGGDEARHFQLVQSRLGALGRQYGDFPAHDGLWEAAETTSENLLARLVVAPLILEARGLDVTPAMIEKLRSAGDEASAAVLEVIYHDEIGHVACGKRWFHAVCKAKGHAPAETFHKLRKTYFAGDLKPPFNHAARDLAGLSRDFYEPN